MVNKRMFSMDIVDSDLFLDMQLSSQCLYFHLSMRADYDGFVIVFQCGVLVITYWKINNYIRKDRYKEALYIEEKRQLALNQNKIHEKDTGCLLVDQRSAQYG